jgi:hypothetical protein
MNRKKKLIPLSLVLLTLVLFAILHYFVSLNYRANSWTGSFIFYNVYLPVSLITSRYIAEIKYWKFRMVILVIFYLIFTYLFLYLYPTIEDIYLFEIRWN